MTIINYRIVRIQNIWKSVSIIGIRMNYNEVGITLFVNLLRISVIRKVTNDIESHDTKYYFRIVIRIRWKHILQIQISHTSHKTTYLPKQSAKQARL